METNYELKHKCLLVPLKAVLLVLAMTLVGFTTYAQVGKSVRVANDQQLKEAMENSSVGSIQLDPGYYTYLGINAGNSTSIQKQDGEGGGNGNRDQKCRYYIIDAKYCIADQTPILDPATPVCGPNLYPPGITIPAGSYYIGNAVAGSNEIVPCGCCPTIPNLGTWEWVKGESTYMPGDSLFFGECIDQSDMDYYVTGPGIYALKYSWGTPWFSYVKTEYAFVGPYNVELSAPPKCGTTTDVDFVLDTVPGTGFVFDVNWTVKDLNTGDIWNNVYPGQQGTGTFVFDGDDYNGCGTYRLYVNINSSYQDIEECVTADSVDVVLSCEPDADAGDDINVCDEECAYLIGSTGLGDSPLPPYAPTYAYSWYQVSGPCELNFDDNFALETEVCRDPYPPECCYGEYEIEFQVQNGKCYDEDNMFLRFYQQPIADAGEDQHICNTFSFSLNAVPFEYCGTEGVNYWPTKYWEIVSQADPTATVTFTPNEFDPNAVVTITYTGECPYGPYEFKWVEENSKGVDMGGCYDEDNVVVTIYEEPAPLAGEDMYFCNTFAFSLYGVGDTPCYTWTTVKYTWEKTSEPGNCNITFDDANILTPSVNIADCGESCPYGEYIFTLTQDNGYMDGNTFVPVCTASDDVSVWIFEEVDAYAGEDQHNCNDFAFTMTAEFTDLCGDEDVNYFQWGEWSFVDGPTSDITFTDINDPETGVTINDLSGCPYGKYTFGWTEYNGKIIDGEFVGCTDYDEVDIYIYEQPDVKAGNDQEYCNTFSFQMAGEIDPLCTIDWAYRIHWELIQQPGTCDVAFDDAGVINPIVTITDCSPCQYGEYVFRVTQANGYVILVGDAWQFIPVCEDSDEVSVWIYEQPEDVYAGEDLNLCNDFAFSLKAVGAEYCGDYGVNYNNWYSWTIESQPLGAECQVVITDPTSLETNVVIGPCAGECPYGEFVFRFTEFNGSNKVYCEAYDEVSVFIFEAPVADAGEDVNACVDIAYTPYCYTMTATYDFCYSMYGEWTKSCGPGDVVFEDINDPASEACFQEPGRYILTWTVWNRAEDCTASDDVIFDLLEQPTAFAGNDELFAPCDEKCIDLGLAEVDKYDYYGTDEGNCPNFNDQSHWSFVSGPDNVTFADDTDPATELCVSVFGCYTVRWNEVNVSVDGETECSDYVDVFVVFIEKPVPDAGPDGSICGNCYTMDAEPYTPNNCIPTEDESYWMFYNYVPPVDPCLQDEFAIEYSPCYYEFDIYDPNAEICICDDCLGSHYGKYGWIWVNGSGECLGYDTVYITYKKKPVELALEGSINPSNCWDGECPNCEVSCLYPDGYHGVKELGPSEDGVIEVCANSCINLGIDWECFCFYGPIPGYTYEWSFIGPSGSYMQAEPYWYDCDDNCWRGSDDVFICFGECCDTARLYLTITTPQGCTTTEEWKFFVNHLPCADIEGPEVSEVNSIATYCNVCPEGFDMSCLLYTWTAEHCGQIVEGQGTECIEVLWTDYNINGGWGEITLTVFDTCTGCCNYDAMDVKVWPAGTLGDATLSGYVYYHNEGNTPLNGVQIQLWNGGIPVMSTVSFNQVQNENDEPGAGPGYYEFTGISATTEFGITTMYDAPWYGANATDALAVELKSIDNLPGSFLYDAVVEDAMNVNNNLVINATDALWIKQRAINMVNYFPAGNWAWDPNMSSVAGNYNIYALSMGDANRSNIPNSMKSMPAINLVTDGTINVVTGQVFELPIRIADPNTFGAMTLDLNYNAAQYEVVDVVAPDGMVFNISADNVGIAWSNINPMTLASNDVVVTLKVKAISEVATAESMFSIGMNSEFADPQAKVIEPVTLKSFGVTTEPAPLDYFLSANRPNPFSTSTFIDYTIPESGKVRLSVLDMLGQEIAVLVDATQTAGSYTVEYSGAGLATGVYMYKITVDGVTRDYVSTQRMVVSH